ncbi:MAG: pilus assembly PilX N-terminal domain-containing protein [Cocleimonas sp.]|nr:pilus assembly PilX N-terminal domain-containing protein [Cocleimonas sp.]
MSYSTRSIRNKEAGATLFTSIVVLLILTVAGISAMQMSTLDIRIASNDEQKTLLYQETENNLQQLTRLEAFYIWLEAQKVGEKGTEDIITDDFTAETSIASLNRKYYCQSDGRAISIGLEVPFCMLYDFNVDMHKQGLGTRDIHHRGLGKEVPRNGGSY